MNPDDYKAALLSAIMAYQSCDNLTGNNPTRAILDSVSTNESEIQGQMIIAKLTFRTVDFRDINMSEEFIKERLAIDLAKKMLESKFIEFTRQDQGSDDTVFRARAFVVPDTQVRILRTHQK